MPYGTVKVDNITFTEGGVDRTITVSGLYASTSGNLTVTGTISGATVQATSGIITTVQTVTGIFGLGSAASPSITFSGDLDNGLYSPGANQVAISTSGTGRLFVDASGRIGVGTTSATAYGMRLAVIENIGLVPATQDTITTSAVAIKTQLGSSGGEELIRSEITSFTNGANYGTATIFTTRNGASTTERMHIDSSGRVGIGTSSPLSLLDVSGAVTAGNSPVAGNDIVLANRTGLGVISNHQSSGAFTYGYGVKAGATSGTWLSTYGTASLRRFAHTVSGANGFTWLSETASTTTAVDSAVTMQELVRINPNGRMGIGTSAPDALLTVNGVGAFGAGTASAPSVAFSGDLNTGIYSPGADQLAISTGGTGRLFVDSAGAVGVGAPAAGGADFEVRNTGANSRLRINSGTVSATSGTSSIDFASAFSGSGVIGTARISGNAPAGGQSELSFLTSPVSNSPTERMRIDSSGRVGIGTSTPSKLLHVQSGLVTGSARGGSFSKVFFESSDATTSYWEFQVASTASNDILFSKGNTGSYGLVGYDHSIEALRFHTNAAERARIDSSGRLLVGTSTATANGGVLQISNGITFPGTQSACSDPNTLDDYEEGTFTPTIVGTTIAGTGTYSAQYGSYTKIGNRVFFQAKLTWSAHTGTGNLRISGLPFTSQNTLNLENVVTSYVGNLVLTASNYQQAYVPINSTQVIFEQVAVGGGSSTAVPIDTAATVLVDGHYII